MSSSRRVLVGANQQVLLALQAHVQQILGRREFPYSFKTVSNHLNPKSNHWIAAGSGHSTELMGFAGQVALVHSCKINDPRMKLRSFALHQ
jgi:hypothetical protein